jgi:hypothetical protein
MRRRRGFFKPTKIENDFNFPPPETVQLITSKGKHRKIADENAQFSLC